MERQHGAAHLSQAPDLQPLDPTICISVVDLVDGGAGVEWDVRDCGSFLKDTGRWQRLRPGMEVPT